MSVKQLAVFLSGVAIGYFVPLYARRIRHNLRMQAQYDEWVERLWNGLPDKQKAD